MKRRHFLWAVGLSVLAAGCSKKPPEGSVDGLKKIVAAITAKDKAAFAACVVPSQRATPGFDASVVTDREIAALKTPDLLDIAFFAEATSIEVDADTISEPTDTSVGIMTVFHHASGSFAARSVKLEKVGSEWLLDVKATIESWYRINGANAFSGIKLVQ